MGPLTAFEILNDNWALALMFLIGIAFGMILEQSGFSTSRKLVGIFYGYDFVVLKVFFTAGLTAMIGLIFMQYFGLIEMNEVFINSNFLWSAIVGGIVMGFGFILGGFCPGTSLTACMIGKIDAWFFVFGAFVGIFLFGKFEDLFLPLFSGYYFDSELIYKTLGIPRSLFVFMMILMALFGFAIGHHFEKRSTRGLKPTNLEYKGYGLEATILVFLGLLIFFIPEQSAKVFSERNEKEVLKAILDPANKVKPEKVAYDIMWKTPNVQFIDVRSEKEFNEARLPYSINIPFEKFDKKEFSEILKDKKNKKILISNGGTLAGKAFVYCKRKGYDNVYILEGGLNNFVKTVFFSSKPDANEFRYDILSNYRFKQKAADFFQKNEFKEDNKKLSLPKENPGISKKTAGGC